MATAGRILIIPKGKYNAEETYDMLDMVSFGGKGWICKKTCIGIEPTDGEYWAECIDMSEEFADLESKTNPLHAVYIDEIDEVIDSTTPEYPYIIGHSIALEELGIGSLVTVEIMSPSEDYICQNAVGESGTATRVYDSESGWSKWNVVNAEDIVETTETIMPNSCEGRLLFKEIVGKTEKLTSTGANVLEEIKVDASLAQWDGMFFAKADLKPSTQYTISFIGAVGNKYYLNEHVFEQAPSFVVEKGINTVAATTKADIASQKNNDGTYTLFKNSIVQPNANKFENVMMNLGLVALPYEPYGVGTPFIRSVAISRIDTHGKNLFNSDASFEFTSVNDYRSIEISGWKFVVGEMKFICNVNGFTPSAIRMWAYDASGKLLVGTQFPFVKTFTQDEVDKINRVCIVFEGIQPNTRYIGDFEIMATTDIDATEYEPYGTSVTFSQPIELNKIGDVKDVIADGKLTKRLASVVLDGTVEPMSVSKGNNGGTVIGYRYDDIGMWAVDRNRNANRVCDRLQSPTTTTPNDFKDCEIGHWGFNNVGYNDEFFIFCIDENFTTFSEVQTWLSTHPIRIVFEIVREYPDLPIADQVALNSLKTCDGTTYLEIDSTLEPEFVAEYGTSKLGGYRLESLQMAKCNDIRISALEASVVNNI